MFQIPLDEYKNRVRKLGSVMERRGVDSVFLSSPVSIKYFSGFSYIQTERPAGIFVNKDLDMFFFGPRLEEEHSMFQSQVIRDAFSYFDYPGKTHPFRFFAKWMKEHSAGRNIGTDGNSLYPPIFGFKGMFPQELLGGAELVDISTSIYDLRKTKTDIEQQLMRENAKWANLAMRLLQTYAKEDLFDFEIGLRASAEASRTAMLTFGMDSKPAIHYPVLVSAGFRGQVGPHSYFPHSMGVNKRIKNGDVLGAGADGNLDGYHVEIERNFFVGEITDQMRKYHALAVAMQQEAISALQIGTKFSDIDRVVTGFAKMHDVGSLLLHHSGHCIGLEGHEPPFFDIGDENTIQPGMIFTVEPGLYVPKVGGFRHSDTIIMQESGPEVITNYVSDTMDLIAGT